MQPTPDMRVGDGLARLLVFRLGAERFAVALAEVHEVIDAPETRPLPDAPPPIVGVATIGGELVTMYDSHALLSAGGRVPDARPTAALLFERHGGDSRRVGVLVDDVYDAMTVDPTELRPIPGANASDGLLVGLVRRGSDLVVVLDAEILLASASMTARREERSA